MNEQDIQEASRLIAEADAVLITAGAGMGVDSGLPDFRGTEGFWRAYPPLKKLGLMFEEMADPVWFDQNPKLAWAFYGHRLHLYRDTIPHRGFAMLLDLAKEKNNNYFVFTSNVDGQFQKAGFDEEKIVEVHGSIHHVQDIGGQTGISSADEIDIDIDMETFEAKNLPYCESTGELLRPNILMFGDCRWDSDRTHEQSARFNRWLRELGENNQKLVILEFGAGKHVPTIRMKSERIAREYNTKVIRINPRDYDINPSLGIGIDTGALEGLDLILK